MKKWIVLPLLFLSACMTQEEYEKQQREESMTQEQRYREGVNLSQTSKQSTRQKMIDEASVVCRDGTAYLVGDSMESWTYGGVFAVPYIKDGVIGGCNGHKGQKIAADKKPIEPEVTF